MEETETYIIFGRLLISVVYPENNVNGLEESQPIECKNKDVIQDNTCDLLHN